MQFFILYGVGLVTYALLDVVWVRYTASLLYRSYVGHLMGHVRPLSLFFLYTVHLVGLTFFATNPAVTAGTVWYALVLGGLYGFFTYSTYSFQNLATLRGWPVGVVIVDIAWGVIASAVTALVTYGVYGLVV